MLQAGESPVYVQRQLGHASIKMTVDTYGRWLPMGNKAAVDRLDDASGGSRTVAVDVGGVGDVLENVQLDRAANLTAVRAGRHSRIAPDRIRQRQPLNA